MQQLLDYIRNDKEFYFKNLSGELVPGRASSLFISIRKKCIYLDAGKEVEKVFDGLRVEPPFGEIFCDLQKMDQHDGKVFTLFDLFALQACRDKGVYTNFSKIQKLTKMTYSRLELEAIGIIFDEPLDYHYCRLQFELELYLDVVLGRKRSMWLPLKNENQKFIKFTKGNVSLVLGEDFLKLVEGYSSTPSKKKVVCKEITNVEYSTFQDYFSQIDFDKEYVERFPRQSISQSITVEELVLYNWSVPNVVEVLQKFSDKQRLVYCHTKRDRVLQSAITWYLSAKFDSELHKACYSYRAGLSTRDAVMAINKKGLYDRVGVKVDISKYFDSVPKHVLDNMLLELTKEDSLLRSLLYSLYDGQEYRPLDGEIESKYLSLIQGCSVATFLGNYLLREVDALLYDLCDGFYARYCDDIIFFCEDEEKLVNALDILRDELMSFELSFNPIKSKYYKPGDVIDFLGLKLFADGRVDMGDNTFKKTKKYIKHFCKKHKGNPKKLRAVISRVNRHFFKDITGENFSWGLFVFRNINCIDTLRELDFYYVNTLRSVVTGKHNFANIDKVPMEMLREHGYLSFVELYQDFKYDFDYYCWKVL